MKKFDRLVFVSLIFLSFAVTGCSNSYEKMIEEFDGKFFSAEPKVDDSNSVKNQSFNQKQMLNSDYVFTEGYFISLEAPDNCDSYLWTCTNSEVEKEVIGTKQTLYYKVPGVFKVGELNTLILTVTATDEDGGITEYIDESVIIIKAQKNLD